MKYKVNWNLDTGAKQHQKNDEIDMKEKDAEQLVASGVLTPLGKPAKASGGTADAKEGDGGEDGGGEPQ